jgi:hypothetical protein
MTLEEALEQISLLPPDDQAHACAQIIMRANHHFWQAEWQRLDVARVMLDKIQEPIWRSACYEAEQARDTFRKWAERARLVPPEERDPVYSVEYHFKRTNKRAKREV